MGKIDYIDTRRATINMLRDWRDQEWKLERTGEIIDNIQTRLTSTTSRAGSAPVSGSGGNHVEEALCAGIAQKDIARHGYIKATEYRADIAPCWERLTDDERYMITARFVDFTEKDGIKRIMKKYMIEQAEAYRRSNRALEHLEKLLFW